METDAGVCESRHVIDLDVFQVTAAAAAEHSGSRSAISLSNGHDGLIVHTGCFARGAAWFRSAANRAVTGVFAESLRRKFGDEVSRAALEPDVFRRQARGKPLRARHVLEVIDSAARLQADFNKCNINVSRLYFRSTVPGNATEALHRLVDLRVRQRCRLVPHAGRFLNLGRIARTVKDDILAAGLAGSHLVTREEAAGIAARVIDRQLETGGVVPEVSGTSLASSIAGRALASAVRADPTLREDLMSLGKRPEGRQLRDVIVKVGSAMALAPGNTEGPSGVENRGADGSCRESLLAAGGEQLARAVSGRIALGGSSLQAVGAGVNWFLEDFLPSGEVQQACAYSYPHVRGTAIYDYTVYRAALVLGAIINALAAREAVGASADEYGFSKRTPDQLPDADIVTLRDLGVPLPAPDRVGVVNPKLRLSRMTHEAVQRNIVQQLNGMFKRGAVNVVVGDRLGQIGHAGLRIDGVWLERGTDSALQQVRAFFSDGQGALDTELLRKVSILAGRETLDSVYSACFDTRRPDLAVFAGRPVVSMNEPAYAFNRDSHGNVLLEISHAGDVQRLEFDDADGFVRVVKLDRERSRLDCVVKMTIGVDGRDPVVNDVVMAYFLSPAGDGHPPEGASSLPVPAAVAQGAGVNRLPPNFDHVGAIARLDQEIALQRAELRALGDGRPDSADRRRMQAELDARLLSRRAIDARQDPRAVLRSRVGEMVGLHGADDSRTRAFVDTCEYLEKTGAFLAGQAEPAGERDALATCGLIAAWRTRLTGLRSETARLRPITRLQVQRAEALADVEAYYQQAIVQLSSGRNPVPELLRHAVELERRHLADGNTAVAEAALLRTMAQEYAELP